MRIYLAGPMRGIPQFNFPAFDEATERLRKDGHEVFSPAEWDRKVYGKRFAQDNQNGDEDAEKGFSIRRALAKDLEWICRYAEAIVVLDGWEASAGVAAERAAAFAIGIPVYTIHEVLTSVSSDR